MHIGLHDGVYMLYLRTVGNACVILVCSGQCVYRTLRLNVSKGALSGGVSPSSSCVCGCVL